MKSLEAQHRAGNPFDEAVVLFERIVQEFDLPDLNGVPGIELLPIPIQDTVKVSSCPFRLDVDIVHPPAGGRRSLPDLCLSGDPRREFHHPAVQRGVIYFDIPFGQGFLEVTVGNAIMKVEEHRVQHRFRIVHALELGHPNHLSSTH